MFLFCVQIFKEFGEFHTVELDQTEDGNAMFDYLHEKTGARTVRSLRLLSVAIHFMVSF